MDSLLLVVWYNKISHQMSLAMLWESVLELADVEHELEDVQEGGLGNNPDTGTDVKKLITLTNI